MFAYYLELAVRSLRRNFVLTALMIAAVGVGIGASMTMLTTLVALSTNPIPDKSSQLFVPQIDGSGYATLHDDIRELPRTLAYRDAMAFLKAGPGTHRAVMYRVGLNVKPPWGDRFPAGGRATDSDFFAMFEVPFHVGAPWGHNEDVHRDNVVVLSNRLADRLFPGTDAVGRTINLDKRDYRIIGVLRHWIPTPRFYDANAGAYSQDEDFFIPFSTAIERQLQSNDYECNETERPGDWAGILSSECPWVQFWAEIPDAGQVRGFRSFLENYAAEQQRQGRFRWLPMVTLRDVPEWLASLRVVPNDVRVNSMIAIGFLIVCLINAVGLMLAKFTSRAVELSVRRALGATRINLIRQSVTEALLVGLLGGVLGLGLTAAGLFALRGLQGVATQDSVAGKLISLNVEMVLITLAVAIVATICSGLYPAWRASRVQPGWQLKAQ
jgi:putative ABC transport system permease protein